MKTYSVRNVAAVIIQEVLDGRSLSDALQKHLPQLSKPQDRAFVQAMCFGICRLYPRLDVLLSYLLKKPLREKDTDVYAFLLIGLYQLLEMRVAPHAAVSETVNAAKMLKKPWSIAVINAVLRSFLRQKDELLEKILSDEEGLYAHPLWLIEKIKKDWPIEYAEILSANNDQPPMVIRINPQVVKRDVYLKTLQEQGIDSDVFPLTEQGILLKEARNVTELPGFAQGAFSVQDGAAQLCASLLMLQPDERILDAAAAPGGKLTQMLETEPRLQEVVAVEKDPHRVELITENLQRLKLKATCITADATQPETWWDGKLFDKILLDAPCSASGVIRRHPDIKILRRATDIAALSSLQTLLLTKLWPLLKPNGILLYVTCSIFKEENDRVIEAFLATHSDAQLLPINESWGESTATGRQILPGMHNMDGFFYARLRKV